MGAAIDRIVVTTTPQEKRALAAKARRLGLPVSELLKRGASAYGNPSFGDDIALLADAATAAADRAAAALDHPTRRQGHAAAARLIPRRATASARYTFASSAGRSATSSITR